MAMYALNEVKGMRLKVKNIKRFFLGLLTFVLSICMITVVSADNGGSIIVNGTKEGKTYEIYKIFDLTYSGTNVSYTIDSDWESFFNGPGASYISDTEIEGLNQITVGSSTKYINITNDNIEEFTKDALTFAMILEGNDGSMVSEGESLTFENLHLGYYLVYPQGATDITEGNGSICSITSTMKTATVNIKALYPTIEKEVKQSNAQVGEMVLFTITGQVPDTTGFTSYTYKIEDTMTEGLKLDSENTKFTVKFGEDTINVDPTYQGNGFTLTFNMVEYQEYVGKTITVTYEVLVTEEAVNSSTTNNSVTLTYSNNPKTDTTTTTPPIEVPVYSSEINIIKVDAKNEETKLEGASFVVQNIDGEYYQAVDVNGIVITNTNKTENVALVKWVKNQEEATLLITETDGTVTFEGVRNGTYYLVELEAPDGYNKLTGPVTVKVGYDSADGTNLKPEAVSHNEIIKNNSGTVLPQTGGTGTTLFIIIGSLLMIIPTILLITNKRMSKEY